MTGSLRAGRVLSSGRLLCFILALGLLSAAACRPDPARRINRLYEAERQGTLTIGMIERALESDQLRVRVAAIDLLGTIDTPRSREILRGLLASPEPAERATAATSLARVGRPGDAAALAPLVEDEATIVRLRAVQALGRIGGHEAALALVGALDDEDDEVRRHAAEGLAGIADPDTVEALLGRLDDPDVRVRAWVIRALAEIGDERAIEPIRRLASSENPFERAAAQTALSRFEERAAGNDGGEDHR